MPKAFNQIYPDHAIAICACEQAQQLVTYDHHVVQVDGHSGVLLTHEWMPVEEHLGPFVLTVVFHHAEKPPAPLAEIQSTDTIRHIMKQINPTIDWRALARTHPSAFLFAAQLLSLVLYAVLDESVSGRALLGAFGVVILILAVWVITRSPAVNWIAWILVIPAIALSLLSIFFVNPTLLIWASLLEAALYFYAAGSMVAYMMKDYRVTVDELFAAGATFTLLAWGYAHAYMVCQTWLPDSFVGMMNPGEPRTFVELLSLSFTNLTATGLGDILPIAPLARVLVMLEQFTGVGYLAVVVSRLIGMTLTQQKDKQVS